MLKDGKEFKGAIYSQNMEFNPNTNVKDMVVLVVDPNHLRYGQVGRMLYHDWQEYGGIGVMFRDGIAEEFYDGLMKGDPKSKINRYYRHLNEKGLRFNKDGAGLRTLQDDFLKLQKGNLEELAEQYRDVFHENLPIPSRLRTLPLELLIKLKDFFSKK